MRAGGRVARRVVVQQAVAYLRASVRRHSEKALPLNKPAPCTRGRQANSRRSQSGPLRTPLATNECGRQNHRDAQFSVPPSKAYTHLAACLCDFRRELAVNCVGVALKKGSIIIPFDVGITIVPGQTRNSLNFGLHHFCYISRHSNYPLRHDMQETKSRTSLVCFFVRFPSSLTLLRGP